MVTLLRPPRRPLPEPRSKHIWTWRANDLMIRVYHEHPHRSPLRARTYGPLQRFDPHITDRHRRPREQRDGRGVNYLAETLGCALAEAFPDQSPEVAICPGLRAVSASPVASVTLLDLTGDGAMRIGAVGTLGAGNEPRRLTQRWARAIYEDFPHLAGVRYRDAHQGGTAVAVWERAGMLRGPASSVTRGPALLDPGMNERVIVALADQGRYPVRMVAADCRRCREASRAA
jgi:RES domain-containing protein